MKMVRTPPAAAHGGGRRSAGSDAVIGKVKMQ